VASGGFGYAFDAHGTLADALDLLGDLARTAELHPSISRVERVEPARGAVEGFRMVDSTRWGPFAFALEYRAELIAREAEDGWARITTRARQAPGIRFWNETVLTQQGDRVHGRVAITLQSPRPIQGWALEAMRARHAEVLPRLVAALERDGAATH
jgi:hypothetical protein